MSTPNQGIALNNGYGHSGAVLAARISENIRRLRDLRGWSRPDLAARLSPPTSAQQIEKLEKSQRRLTIDWIERVAKGLGVDPGELIAGQAGHFELTEQVSGEVAEMLARVTLQGGEPSPAIVHNLAIILRELSATFAKHPQARHDPEALRPVIDLLGRQHAQP